MIHILDHQEKIHLWKFPEKYDFSNNSGKCFQNLFRFPVFIVYVFSNVFFVLFPESMMIMMIEWRHNDDDDLPLSTIPNEPCRFSSFFSIHYRKNNKRRKKIPIKYHHHGQRQRQNKNDKDNDDSSRVVVKHENEI